MLDEVCYKKVGTDSYQAEGCDLLTKDLKDYVRLGLNFQKLVEENPFRYVYTSASLKEEIFWQVSRELYVIYKKFEEIEQEFEDHKFLLIHKINEYVKGKQELLDRGIEFTEHHEGEPFELFFFGEQGDWDFKKQKK